jgi:Holliday junction resolvase
MNGKAKGTRNEHKSIRYHLASGASVIRSGGSLGLFDFVALYGEYALLVQVKSNRWPGRVEMEALSAFPTPHYGRKIIERWDDYARSPLVREIV